MDFFKEMKVIKRVHQPSIIMILEPKISRNEEDEVNRRLEKSH